MTNNEIKYVKDTNLSNQVTKTKVSHGRIETTIRVRSARTKNELDLEARRLKLLNNIEKTTTGESFILPSELKNWQQLILILGTLKLKSTTEVVLACKKFNYSGSLNIDAIQSHLC